MNKEIDNLFKSIINNKYILYIISLNIIKCNKILVTSPTEIKKYKDITDIRWLVKNGYYHLLIDKIKVNGIEWVDQLPSSLIKPIVKNLPRLDILMTMYDRHKDQMENSCYLVDAAVESGDLERVKRFHEIANKSSRVLATGSALHVAAANGYLDIVQFLYMNRREGCNNGTYDTVACNGHLKVLLYVLSKNKRAVMTKKAMDGAAAGGFTGVVEYLHRNRSEGCTSSAMDCAAAGGHIRVVEFLHYNRVEGCTTYALDKASFNGHLDVVTFLIQNRQGGYSWHAIEQAVLLNRPKILYQLLSAPGLYVKKSPYHIYDKMFHQSCLVGVVDMVDLLLPHVRRESHMQAFDVAAGSGSLELVKFLHTNSYTKSYCSPAALFAAAAKGHLDIVKFICENRFAECGNISNALTISSTNLHHKVAQYLTTRIPHSSSSSHQLQQHHPDLYDSTGEWEVVN